MDYSGSTVSRRSLLKIVGCGSISGLAGCNYLANNKSSTSERKQTSPASSTETTTNTETPDAADTKTPSLSVSLRTEATEVAGELEVQIHYEVEALKEIIVSVNGEQALDEESSGDMDGVFEETITTADAETLHPGEVNKVRGTVRNENGRSATESTQQYVRKFDVLENHKLDVAVSYVPWFNKTNRWQICTDGRPSIGYYSMEEGEALLQQVDYMQGFGLTTLQLHFDRPEKYIRAFTRNLNKEPLDSMPIEIYYTRPFHGENSNTVIEQLKESFDYVVENYIPRKNYNTFSGHPVVHFWDIDWIPWAGTPEASEARDAILSEWESYKGFVDFIRSKHTIKAEPYLVAGTGDNAVGGFPEEFEELNKHFDALTTWISPLEDNETTSWEQVLTHVEENYQATQNFAEKHNMDFIPMVFPGFDTRPNNCWGSNEHIPRSLNRFKELLDLADQYKSVERINVATWNDWGEGHQIEPGSFRGNNYGTGYLDVVKAFQKEMSVN